MKLKEFLKNYKVIFILEVLTFILIAIIEVILWDQTGRIFGTNVILGIPTFSWIFLLVTILFLVIPIHAGIFGSKLMGTFAIGYLIGNILGNFIFFILNSSFGITKFNSSYIPQLDWIKIGQIEVPIFYPGAALFSIIIWFIFIKHSKKIDEWLK